MLGFDIIYNKKLLYKDCSENDIYNYLNTKQGKNSKLVLTVIGNQGFLFGRGNQQISPKVIQIVGKKNIIILSTKTKVMSVLNNCFLVDTGEEKLDQDLRGYYRVTVGYREYLMCKIG